jgi:hypothetical protein
MGMSREAAATPPDSGSGSWHPGTAPPSTPRPPSTGTGFAEVHAQAPSFTAAVDQEWATVRVRGHVDRVGAELLCDAVVGLQRCGHRRVTVQLRPSATLDAEARGVLTELAARLAEDGLQLDVR